MRVVERPALTLTTAGVADNRRFFLVDERGRLVNGKHVGELGTVVARYDDPVLTLTFPDGAIVSGTVELGEPFDARFFSLPAARATAARPVVGCAVGLVRADAAGRRGVDRSGVDRGRGGAVSLISRASLDGLARGAGEQVDARRFRMLVEIDGVAGPRRGRVGRRRVRIGGALVRFRGHVGRCSITTRHPESGVVDLPTLDLLRSYRGELDTTEPLAFGVYGEVLEGGRVAVGDAVELVA